MDEQLAERIKRFREFQRQERVDRIEKDRKEVEADDQDALAALWFVEMSAYEERLERITQRLDDLTEATDRALKDARRDVQLSQQRIQDIQDRAAKLDDGTAVYRTQDRTAAFDDHGIRLTREEIDAVAWPENAPTWEERQEAAKAEHLAIAGMTELEDYRERLEQHRDRIEAGTKTPLPDDELDAIERDLEDMPGSVRSFLQSAPARTTSAAEEFTGTAFTQAPQMGESFRDAVKGTVRPMIPTVQEPVPHAALKF